MAHSISAKKRTRQNVRRRNRNRARRATLKTRTRKFNETLATPAAAANADASFRSLTAVIDRAAAQGTIHRNAAARRKSRLARRLNALKPAAAG